MIKHTFASTDVSIEITPINPMFAVTAQRLLPKAPLAPKQKIESGPGTYIEVDNEGDATYQAELSDYRVKCLDIIDQLFVDIAVKCDMVDIEPVTRMREVSAKRGITLDGSDLFLYVRFFACSGEEDWNTLVRLITSRGGVTAEAVEAASAVFRGDISEASDSGVVAPKVGYSVL